MAITRRTTTVEDAAPAATDYAPDEGFTPEDENDVTPVSGAKRGWGAAKKAVVKSSAKFENEFKVSEEDQLIKFMEDEPFWAGATHWVDEIKEGKRSFYCLDDECPLCGVGHETRASIWFNVVPLTDENGPAKKPEVAILKAGSLLSKLIEEEHDGRYGPISRHYWRIKKSGGGKKGKVNYTLSVVKAGDLASEWDLNPEEVVATLADLKPYDDSVVRYTSAEDLQEVVDEHLV